MVVLYVIGGESKRDYIEFRWSLRSLEKHATNVEPVLIGSRVRWFNGPYIPCDDPLPYKNKNINRKLMIAIDKLNQKDEFLYSADDHFITKDIDFDCAPLYWKKPILPEKKDTAWERICGDTRDVLFANGYPAMDFSQHFNTFINPSDIDEVNRIVSSAKDPLLGRGYETGSMWVNVALGNGNGRRLEHREDLKFSREPLGEIKSRISENIGFSINDNFLLRGENVEYIKSLYPYKSRWES